MIKLSELKKILSQSAGKNLVFTLPTGTRLPCHAHVTEVARIEKKYVDCGGTFRADLSCRLQTWYSDDTDHRLTARGLAKAIERASAFLETDDMGVDVECEAPFISQFPISKVEAGDETLEIFLGVHHTACLAPELCIPPGAMPKIDFQKPFAPLSKSKCC